MEAVFFVTVVALQIGLFICIWVGSAQRILLLSFRHAFIPAKTSYKTLEPVLSLIQIAQSRDRILWWGYNENIPWLEGRSISTIKGRLSGGWVMYKKVNVCRHTQQTFRESSGRTILSSMESGSNMGRNDKVCGQIGVNNKAGTSGCTMDPPADS